MISLIDKVQNYRVVDSEKTGPMQLSSYITGCNLVWARAKFEHSSIQINKFNHVKIEIFSKVGTPLKVASVALKMS